LWLLFRGIIEEASSGPIEGGEDFPVTAIDLAYTVSDSPRLALKVHTPSF